MGYKSPNLCSYYLMSHVGMLRGLSLRMLSTLSRRYLFFFFFLEWIKWIHDLWAVLSEIRLEFMHYMVLLLAERRRRSPV